jgi:hypothetical protein
MSFICDDFSVDQEQKIASFYWQRFSNTLTKQRPCSLKFIQLNNISEILHKLLPAGN